MTWIYINCMRDIKKSIDNIVEIDFKRFSLVYQSTLKLKLL